MDPSVVPKTLLISASLFMTANLAAARVAGAL